MVPPIWQTEFGDGPLVACAIHDGHAVRPEVADSARARRDAAALRRRSLHRPLDGHCTDANHRSAVAVRGRSQPAARNGRVSAAGRLPGAWNVWKSPPPPEIWSRDRSPSMTIFTPICDLLLERLRKPHGGWWSSICTATTIVAAASAARPTIRQQNPEINVGTGSMDRARWASDRRPLPGRAAGVRLLGPATGRPRERKILRRRIAQVDSPQVSANRCVRWRSR